MKKLTTASVAERMGVAQVTVNVWCLQGRFPNAVREETARGPVWSIPESDLVRFKRPKMGRPTGKKAARPAKKKLVESDQVGLKTRSKKR